jgi:hypothetical protein
MTQPSYVPIVEADQVREAYRLRTPLPWRADRVADLRNPGQPRGREMGIPGPDQGYALLLAHRLFEERLALGQGITVEDALSAAAAVGCARAALFGRAPVAKDIEAALVLFGFLGHPTTELVEWRTPMFRGAAHHYEQRHQIVDCVSESALRMTAEELSADPDGWRSRFNSDG